MSVFLEPVSGEGLKIPIDKAIIFIGRHPDCDIVITRSRMISRKHCALVQIDDSLMIRDLGSTNGVRVNGARVRKEARFRAGDTVTIGDLDYVVRSVKTPEPERRPKREHPQDARSAGSSPPREPANATPEYSQEIPVAIPTDEETFDSDSNADTPDSFPFLLETDDEEAAGAEPANPDRSAGFSPPDCRSDAGLPSSDAHLPLTE